MPNMTEGETIVFEEGVNPKIVFNNIKNQVVAIVLSYNFGKNARKCSLPCVFSDKGKTKLAIAGRPGL